MSAMLTTTMPEMKKVIGKLVNRRLRDQYGISQEKLCAELQRRGCDIGRTAYAKYESGELNIRASVLIELRKIYSCSYDDFFAGLDRNIE